MQNSVKNMQQQNIQQTNVQNSTPQMTCAPQYPMQPQYNMVQGQYPPPQYNSAPQNIPVPNYSGVNIQIFNPSVAAPGAPAPVYNVNAPQYQNPCYPSDYYTNTWGQNGQNNNANNTNTTTTTTTTTTNQDGKKTEKRDIVVLTDSYIKNLENYLNSQDKQIRLMGAKEVAARLHEDPSRKDDKALTALINKMLQDPYQPVKFIALTALSTREVTGDAYTAGVLEQMRNSTSNYGQDAMLANQILLKMSGQVVKKEFEVDPNKKEPKKS